MVPKHWQNTFQPCQCVGSLLVQCKKCIRKVESLQVQGMKRTLPSQDKGGWQHLSGAEEPAGAAVVFKETLATAECIGKSLDATLSDVIAAEEEALHV